MKNFVLVVAVIAVAVTGWRWHAKSAHHDESSLVDGRLWIDHLPRDERDMVSSLVVLRDQPIGAFGASSRWQFGAELFEYELALGKLEAKFPQTGALETYKVGAKKCASGSFDFCLEVSGGKHGVERYYSMEGWEVESVAAEQKLLAKLATK